MMTKKSKPLGYASLPASADINVHHQYQTQAYTNVLIWTVDWLAPFLYIINPLMGWLKIPIKSSSIVKLCKL
ncbi:hypothetical protein BLOT_015178 [Blomia tropicalis]|nr:hypothetical protein BLOT_015178 [Blomia tropicalis]